MKTCPQCGELNGDSRVFCFKCQTALPRAESYRKICLKCKTIHAGRAESCETCGGRLSVYSEAAVAADRRESGSCLLYIVSVLIPIAGIILGCIYIARQEDELGKSLLATSIVTWVIAVLLGIAFAGCSLR